MNLRFLIIFEESKTGVGATAPDIPGCFAVGPTVEETRRRYLEAVEAHLRWMASEQEPLPQPVTSTFNFSPEPGEEPSAYHVEWLSIPFPIETRQAIPA